MSESDESTVATLRVGTVAMVVVLILAGVYMGRGLAESVIVALASAGVWLAWRLRVHYGGVLN